MLNTKPTLQRDPNRKTSINKTIKERLRKRKKKGEKEEEDNNNEEEEKELEENNEENKIKENTIEENKDNNKDNNTDKKEEIIEIKEEKNDEIKEEKIEEIKEEKNDVINNKLEENKNDIEKEENNIKEEKEIIIEEKEKEVEPIINKLNLVENENMNELEISPITQENEKSIVFTKNEPFGDLSEIIKKNILSQNKKAKKINKEIQTANQSKININLNNYLLSSNTKTDYKEDTSKKNNNEKEKNILRAKPKLKNNLFKNTKNDINIKKTTLDKNESKKDNANNNSEKTKEKEENDMVIKEENINLLNERRSSVGIPQNVDLKRNKTNAVDSNVKKKKSIHFSLPSRSQMRNKINSIKNKGEIEMLINDIKLIDKDTIMVNPFDEDSEKKCCPDCNIF